MVFINRKRRILPFLQLKNAPFAINALVNIGVIDTGGVPCDYLHKFSRKKIDTAFVSFRGSLEDDCWKNLKSKNLLTLCPFKRNKKDRSDVGPGKKEAKCPDASPLDLEGVIGAL